MTLKKKLAALAAFAALSAPAFALTDLDLATIETSDLAKDYAIAELAAAGTSTADGNYAQIWQEASSGIAYIDQSGGNNFASIVQQTNDASIGVIYQLGDSNRAAIYQH